MSLPEDWRPLKFANQTGTATLWAEGDLDKPTKVRLIYLLFTGDFVPEGVRYIGTDFFGASKELVVHCYVG